ncbi:hypothetical protein, partial [Pseudomonas graminis]
RPALLVDWNSGSTTGNAGFVLWGFLSDRPYTRTRCRGGFKIHNEHYLAGMGPKDRPLWWDAT